ncbi:MAG: AFG1/ZapE family ATPase [Candidatus Acidiferrales bacterium]
MDRKSRQRRCHGCHTPFELPAQGETAKCQRFGYCGEQCHDAGVRIKLEHMGVPPKCLDHTFAGFSTHTKHLAEKVRFIQRWASSDLEAGLYLFGNVGTGKTRLAVAAMRELIKRGLRGRFVNARRFILLCQTAFGRRESAEEVVYEILDAGDFLVLDDFGSEKATDYVRQSLLHLVDECYTREVTLVVTSNVDLEALNQLDERIASRLMEISSLVKFSEQDYRARIAKSRREPVTVEEGKVHEKEQADADTGTPSSSMAEGRCKLP